MQALIRALRILREVGQANAGVNLQEISDRLDIPLASAYRMLSTLLDEGFLVRSPTTKRYFAGPRALTLSNRAVRTRHLYQVPPGALARAAMATGETVFLTEYVEHTAMCVAIASGRRHLRLSAQLGGELPWHAAAAARVLLTDRADAEIRELLSRTTLEPFTARTPTEPEQVLASIHQVRLRGFDTCEDELDDGVSTISIPIRYSSGRYSLTLAAPTQRLRTASVRQTTARALMTAARELQAELARSPKTPPTTGSRPLQNSVRNRSGADR